MIVKFIGEMKGKFKETYKKYGYNEDTDFGLTVNKNYKVYGITTINKDQLFLICQDHFDGIYINFPRYFPRFYFEIIDGSLSNYWLLHFKIDRYDNNEEVLEIGIPPIVEDPFFYGNLVEGVPENAKIFLKFKKLIDQESMK